MKGLLCTLISGLASHYALANPLPYGEASTAHGRSPLVASRQHGYDPPGCGKHGPGNRKCWEGDWDINTNWGRESPSTGVTREYTLVITNMTEEDGFSADGVVKPAMLINKAFPGTTIEADWGDELAITVKNEMQDNGTSIHWHGIWQKFTNDQDGANGVTECPIPPGAEKTYHFKMHQYGTGWYHSHFSAQYGNGIAGAIVVNGPASANYDVDLGPMFITDWYYDTADNLERQAAVSGPPASDNILFNGTNVNKEGGGQYSRTMLKPGKKHRLRLINGSVDNTMTISLVNHNFTVIAADFVPVEPVVKDTLFLTVGQRYDVIIDADQDADNFWMNATWVRGNPIAPCGESRNELPAAIFTYEGAKDEAGIPSNPGKPVEATCRDTTGFQPVVEKGAPRDEFNTDRGILDVNFDTVEDEFGGDIFRWTVNASDIDIQWGKPTLQYVREKNNTWPRRNNIIEIPDANIWTWWVVENVSPLAHPMHLHGHDFLHLGSGAGSFDPAADVEKLNFANPMRRDVVQMDASGWIVVAFQTDNPGAHLLHCHIAWHVSRGLSVQFLEREDDIGDTFSLEGIVENCERWKEYEKGMYWPKHDSGL